jgi:hypothetical protein
MTSILRRVLGLTVDKFPEFPEFPNYPATLKEPTPLATNHPFSPVGNPLNDAFEMSQLMHLGGGFTSHDDSPGHQQSWVLSRYDLMIEALT